MGTRGASQQQELDFLIGVDSVGLKDGSLFVFVVSLDDDDTFDSMRFLTSVVKVRKALATFSEFLAQVSINSMPSDSAKA